MFLNIKQRGIFPNRLNMFTTQSGSISLQIKILFPLNLQGNLY